MGAILVKVFATALAVSQVVARPDAVQTRFDPVADRAAVVALLRDGCAHMRRAFDIEDINLDELIDTAMEDPQAVTGGVDILRGLSFSDLHASYREFCKNETLEKSPVDIAEVISFYNGAAADLPDHTTLVDARLPGLSVVRDEKGQRFAEVFEPDHRRVWVPLSDIPEPVRQAFVAAEDKNFFKHDGVDERGVVRAFIGNLTNPNRPQGGSTITQQVAKNLLVGDDVTYERKIREVIVAARIERALSKEQILEIYLNAIFLGRSSWGVETAARSWFGKSAKALTLEEGALLAALTKGPNHYAPDRHPQRARERFAYVLSRMEEEGFVDGKRREGALAALPALAAFERPRRENGLHFIRHVEREARTLAGIESLTASSYDVRTTLNPALQKSVEAAVQEGLARYELNTGRFRLEKAEINLAETVARLDGEPPGDGAQSPAWRRALAGARLPLHDVHWPAAIVVSKKAVKGGGQAVRVGLADGRILPLKTYNAATAKALALHDVVHVRLVPGKKAGEESAELRMRPSVQGAALVLENRTGRILAMSGGFSYPLSQLNRATQAHRQPGSAIKPLTYLAALAGGLQPNTLIFDAPIVLPPIGGRGQSWAPRNYEGGGSGAVSLRRALENSRNRPTAHLLDGGIAARPEDSLQRICELAQEAQLYIECAPYYPFILGAQPLKLMDLAAFYAAIANEGAMPSPHVLEAVEEGGRTLFRREPRPLTRLGSADEAAFYQLKSILQGVLERGTARSLKALAPYVAGKTGTSDNENDAWFVGFTNEVTVAVWVGYDNADGKRRTLGRGQTGGKVAIPIFEEIVKAAWDQHAPRTALAPPSPRAQAQLVALSIDVESGHRVTDGRRAFTEHFRLDGSGRLAETRDRLVRAPEVYALRDPHPFSERDPYALREPYGGRDPYPFSHDRAFDERDPYAYEDERRNGWAPRWDERHVERYEDYDRRGRRRPSWRAPYDEAPLWREERVRPRRVDPDYFWRPGRLY